MALIDSKILIQQLTKVQQELKDKEYDDEPYDKKLDRLVTARTISDIKIMILDLVIATTEKEITLLEQKYKKWMTITFKDMVHNSLGRH